MTEQEMCKAICKAASDKKARDIVTMDMQGLMISPDYFVICSANTATQVRAIADNIEEELAKDGVAFSHKEGYREGDWVLRRPRLPPGDARVLCARTALGRCEAHGL